MINKIITLTILLMLSSCSEPIKDVTGDSNQPEVITLNNLENIQLEYEASASNISDVEIGPVFLSNGEKISNANQFEVTPNLSDIKKVALEIDSYSDDDDIFSKEKTTISGTDEGLLKFRIKIPKVADDYTVSIKSKEFPSLGVIKIKIKPKGIHSIGSVQSEIFKDLAPYNGQKEINESFAVVNNAETSISLGPVLDEFGNKIKSGKLDVFIANGYLGAGFQDKDGNLTAQGTFSIIEGSVTIPVRNLTPDNQVRVLAAVSGTVTNANDFNNLPPGKFIDQELEIVDSFVSILGLTNEDELDFGVVFVGRNSIKTLNVKNLGNAKISNLNIQVDAPFVKVGGTCEPGSTLAPGQECSVDIQYSAQSRVFGNANLEVSGRFSGVVMPPKNIALLSQGAMPANLQLSLENNLIEFNPTPVGDVITQVFTAVNMGDVDATNLNFIQPPPHPGQNVGFFTFRSPPPSVPNDEPELGEHCGQILSPQKRCKIYIDFLPQGKVGSEILAGNVVIDDSNPLTIFVKGKSYVNNFERTIGVSAIKYDVKKDETDTVSVVVGPIRDIYGIAVADQDVQIEVFKWANKEKTLRKPLGRVFSPNLIIGSDEDIHIIRTDSQGYANFQLKSKIDDQVGSFVVEAKIKDVEGNILTIGSNEQFRFIGVDLAFDEEIYNYARTVVNQKVIKEVKIKNQGSLDAQNVGINLSQSYFVLENEGSCVGLATNSLSLDIEEECIFELSFTPLQRTALFDYMRITSSNFGSKDVADVYGVGISPVELNSETPRYVATHVLGQNIPLKGFIVFNNIGDETAINLSARAIDENQSFLFSFTCETLEMGRSCVLNFEYDPQIIPNQVLETQIAIAGVGQQAGILDEVRIPIQITHSSMMFKNTEPGININRCHELQIIAFDTENDNLDYTQDIPLVLSNEGAAGSFYFDLNCSTPISSIAIKANTYKTDKFYYRPLAAGFHVLRANSPEIASAVKGFKIYKEPVSLAVTSGNAQNSFTERMLNPPLIVKVLDEDGKGVPNIPLSLTILEDLSQKSQLITNSSFNSGIGGWTTSSGAQWFRGYGGSLRLASATKIESAESTAIPVNSNNRYFYALRVTESIGTPATAAVKIQLINANTSGIIQEHIVEGKKTQVFEFNPQSSETLVKIKVSTMGFSSGTAAFIDAVYFTDELNAAGNNPIRYGTIQNNLPFISGFTGEGEFELIYKTGEIPGLISIMASSDYPTLNKPEALMNVSVEFPTNITGALGDLLISSNGVFLEKNGGNNLTALSSISGYNWNNITKTLSLPANQVYDFNNIVIDANTTLKFTAPSTKVFDWTSVYAKQSCLVNGKIELKGFKTNNNTQVINAVGLDGETLSATLNPYPAGKAGASGGEGGFRTQIRTRTASAFCLKGCSWNYSNWTGWNWNGSYSSQYSRLTGGAGSSFKGGDGAPGRPGKFGTTIRPVGGNGGLGGNNGNDGGLLFLHCFLNLQGTGSIDVMGSSGSIGGNGTAGNYYVGAASATKYQYYSGLSPISIEETRRVLVSGGGGGGAGGDGGRGGKLIIKTKNVNHSLSLQYLGGSGGLGGQAGPSSYNLTETNGLIGPVGNKGESGSCQEVNGPVIVNCP